MSVLKQVQVAKEASIKLAVLPAKVKNKALLEIADSIKKQMLFWGQTKRMSKKQENQG